MSEIDKIKKLRQSTGAGFKDCNLALKESDGDLEKAAEILRIKGVAKASKKMTREAIHEQKILLNKLQNVRSELKKITKDVEK